MEFPFNLVCLMLCIASVYSSFTAPLCHENEKVALLHFKLSLSINKFASSDPSAYPKTETWKPTGNKSDCCFWDGIQCSEKSNYVISLDLSSSYLYGFFNPNSTLFELVYLQTLNLADNNFQYSLIPSKINHLFNLKYLNLSRSVFSGGVPTKISQLSKLISLDLSYNVDPLSGAKLLNLGLLSLKSLVQSFTSLKVLNLDQVSIFSRVPKVLANFTSMRLISLSDCGLHGAFPKGIFFLPNLELLNIGDNSDLIGQLPEFHNNSKLQVLILENTRFSGKIPTSVGNLGSLIKLSITNCSFEGEIPDSLGKLTQLKTLELSFNNFRGQIPTSLGNLTQLVHLGLAFNQLIGEVPSFIANFTRLTILELGSNMLHGSIPSWISRLENLEALDLLANMLGGSVDFGMFMKLQRLQFLGLSDVDLILQAKTQTNDTFHQFLMLTLKTCNLTQFPNFLQNQTELELLSLEDNRIQGSIPIPSLSLVDYDVSYNKLSGEIPPLICNLTFLDQLFLQHNKLSGALPPCFGNLSNSLSVLELQGNNLHGVIPEAFTTKCRLKWISLSSNQLQGKVPRSLANCLSLEILDLGNNHINDAFPIWPRGLPGLHALLLGSNRLHGVIPRTFGFGFPKLRIIDLSNNKLVGNLSNDIFLSLYAMGTKGDGERGYIDSTTSTHVSNIDVSDVSTYYITLRYKGAELSGAKVLKVFTSIDLSGNKFGGEIPDAIGSLVGLQSLNLSHNNFRGGIPASFGSILSLESLDLAYNMLSGDIPQELTALTFLAIFNVSYNKLTGAIPEDNQFNTFGNDSYEGNIGLCGTPLSKCGKVEGRSSPQLQTHSDEEEGEESTTLPEWIIISLGYVSGLVVGVIIGQIISTKMHEWFIEIVRRVRCNKRKAK